MRTRNQCERLADFVGSAPELGAALPAELSEHARACLLCQAELHAASKLARLFGELGHGFEPSPFVVARAVVRASAAEPGRPPLLSARLAAHAVFAAAAVAGVAGIVWWSNLRAPDALREPASAPASADPSASARATTGGPAHPWDPAPGEPARAEVPHLLAVSGCSGDVECRPGAVLGTGPGQRRTVALSDGTRVHVNHDTRASLSADTARTLLLDRGEVLLDVVRQAQLPPLQVRLPHGLVRVTGTRLMAASSEAGSVVTVLSGRVEVDGAGSRAAVSAGEEAVLRAGAAPRVRAAPDLAEATRWSEVDREATEGSMALGTLRARVPGKSDDTEQALRLTEHSVSVRVQGQVARTVVEESFRNETKHTMEGVYSFPVPAGARIAGLDLLVDGTWEEGAIVERGYAEKVWKGVIRNATPKQKRDDAIEYVWVPGPWRDPAILNFYAGSRFELRIFPIPARGERRVRIAYTETLRPIPGGRRYVYPLSVRGDSEGPVAADRFLFDASVGLQGGGEIRASPYPVERTAKAGVSRLRFSESAFAPRGDIVLDVLEPGGDVEVRTWAYSPPASPEAPAGAAGDGRGYGLVALRPDLPSSASAAAGGLDVLFVVDTSYATQRARLDRAARLVSRVTAELDRESRVHALACATRCRPVGPGFREASSRVAADLSSRLEAIEPLGATWMTHAFEQAAAALASSGARPGRTRVVYIGDGVPAMGELQPARLAASARSSLSGHRVTTVSLGGDVDEAVLQAVARAGGGAHVDHGPGSTLRDTAWRVLQHQWGGPLRDARLELPPAFADAAPAALGDLWPGEERLVAGRVSGPVRGEAVLRGTLDGAPYERRWSVSLDPQPTAGNAFLPRLWAEQRMDELQLREDAEARSEIVALSKRYHVLSRHTSLLVLESPAMARAFRVEPTRPAVEWTGSDAPESTPGDSSDSDARSAPASELTAARSGSAFRASGKMALAGSGLGLGGAGRPTKQEQPVRAVVIAPRLAASAPTAGHMDRGSIQGVVRRHVGQLKRVYERALKSNPSLQGKAVVRFTIGADGRVVAVRAVGTLPDDVRAGLEGVVRQWRFPEPEGGPVSVTYPFVFTTSGDTGGSPSPAGPLPNRVWGLGEIPRPGSWVPMKKVWYREATITAHRGLLASEERELSKRKARLSEKPESRDRTRDLVQWRIRIGDLDAAEHLARQWLEKDRLDAGALVALSDVAGVRGDRDRARDLLASAVDADPRSAVAHERMSALYDAAGERPAACAHALARSILLPADVAAQVDAVRCGSPSDRHMTGLDKDGARKASKLLRGPEKPAPVRGSLEILAKWDGAADLDIVVVTPKGRRVSWQGGARTTRVAGALAVGREELAMSTGEPGRYQVFVVHGSAEESGRVSGTLRVRAHGTTRRLRFETDGRIARAGEVHVSSHWRHERVQ